MTVTRTAGLLVAALVGTCLSSPGYAQGDVLLIERLQRAPIIERPENGLSMAEVRDRFGEPNGQVDAVGSPPISRWIYPAFTVYFEHDKVINAVVNRSDDREIGPRDADPQ